MCQTLKKTIFIAVQIFIQVSNRRHNTTIIWFVRRLHSFLYISRFEYRCWIKWDFSIPKKMCQFSKKTKTLNLSRDIKCINV